VRLRVIDRRGFPGLAAGTGATLALNPDLARAFQPDGALIQRAVPSTGEKLPVVGLSFSNHVSCADHTALREVFKTFVGHGGKVFDNTGVSCGTVSRNLFAHVGNTPLPEWAADFDAKTWAHFFLKYVISHPAITVARVGTTKASHMLDNLGGGIGRLPDDETRKRMAAFIDALPQLPPLRAPQ
jgi:diketogulonate reductase-like aldo/keto reductase